MSSIKTACAILMGFPSADEGRPYANTTQTGAIHRRGLTRGGFISEWPETACRAPSLGTRRRKDYTAIGEVQVKGKSQKVRVWGVADENLGFDVGVEPPTQPGEPTGRAAQASPTSGATRGDSRALFNKTGTGSH